MSNLSSLVVVPGLDPRQGGVQVSAVDALGIDATRQLKCVIFGNDPLGACALASQKLISDAKLKLVSGLLRKNWSADVGVFWHLSMLRLLPFLRGFRGRRVVFLHGIETWREHSPSMLKRLQSVDLFLSNSDFTWQKFLEFAPGLVKHPHITTPLGFGSPVSDGVHHFPASPSVLIIARMVKAEDYKGHRELIQAWPKVVQAIPHARLDIVGEGDLRAELQELAKNLGVSAHVHFHGRIDENEKERLLRSCSIFAMPSRGEGFGIVYLEAMRYGRPCVVSNCDAAREVVNPPEAGFEVDPGNIDHLANSIVQLLSDHDVWSRMSAAASARYQAHYTVDAYRRRLWAAIDTVLE